MSSESRFRPRDCRPRPRPSLTAALVLVALALPVRAQEVAPQQPPPPGAPVAAPPPQEPVERLKLETTDGVQLASWYYPPLGAAKPDGSGWEEVDSAAVVILLHDLDGSHTSVEPLARSLQRQGVAVVAPDLRGHGASTSRAGGTLETRSLKKPDFDMMAVSRGGAIREQASSQGDVETVRNWVKDRAAGGTLDMERLFVVGTGLGAAVAVQWALADASWPDIASGRQGRDVRGLVLVSPTWTTRGFALSQAMTTDVIRKRIPIMVIGGRDDRDGVKLYDQLKRQRPNEWYEKRAGEARPAQSPKAAEDARPTLYLLQFDAPLAGDKLAAYRAADPRARAGDPAGLIVGFITSVSSAAAE